ncbi:MAG: caspase family protein [Myxococcales bacterium]|nr:caspase family protein [Myxococcales bacterium]
MQRRGLSGAAGWPVALTLLFSASPALAESRRIAVVAGNNAGSGELPPLRYAENDAGKMARVLVELGEVAEEDVRLLQGRGVSELEKSFAEARERVAALERSPDTRTVLLFYFSGHSDGEAIEMGREKLPYGRLKALLAGTGADVRVAIVDACKSGAAVLEKGGRPAEPFTIKLTDSLVATGEAFITSSAADESALESAEVMGSFFTHNLVSGLRGAADESGDKLVTLAEAYRYAYDRTVSATAMMPVGSQHPTYDYRLSGQGELVLSTLLRTSALLVLPQGAERALVTDLSRDQVLVELPQSAAREVAVAPGSYGVRLFKEGKSFGGRYQVGERSRTVVRWEELSPLSSSVVVAAKGAEVRKPAPEPSPRAPLLALSLGGALGVAQGLGLQGMARLTFEPSSSSGLSFGLLGATGSSAAEGFSESGLQLRAGYRLVWSFGAVSLSAGGELGLAYVWQRFPAEPTRSALSLGAGPRGTVRVQAWGPVWLSAEADLPVFLFSTDGRLQLVPMPTGSVGLALMLR